MRRRQRGTSPSGRWRGGYAVVRESEALSSSRKARSAFRTTTELVAGTAGNPRGCAARGDRRTESEDRGSKDGSASRLSNHAPVSSLPASLLPLASSRGLPRWARSASLRERSAPFDFPPEKAGRPAIAQLNTTPRGVTGKYSATRSCACGSVLVDGRTRGVSVGENCTEARTARTRPGRPVFPRTSSRRRV